MDIGSFEDPQQQFMYIQAMVTANRTEIDEEAIGDSLVKKSVLD